MPFFQAAPTVNHGYDDDDLVQEYLARVWPEQMHKALKPELQHLGSLGQAELYEASLVDRLNEPEHTRWNPWGHRVDEIEVTSVWKRAATIAAEHGLVAAGYEPAFGPHARGHQFIANYLVSADLDIYSCPLAMTDGAAATLRDSGNQALIDRAVGRLTSRDPARMWTSGQWMTERTGGSDVGRSETIARPVEGDTERHLLYGTKWFTSAVTSQMALALARPEGQPEGGRHLALFYVELRDAQGRLQNIHVNRLKDKLGTRKVPTAELTLDGTPAIAVKGLSNGTRNIASMLNVTRTWNSVAAAWGARRAVVLALDYAQRREVFGAPLNQQPLHVDTLATMVAEQEAIFHLAFRTVEILGAIEHQTATDTEQELLRILTPICKLTTAKQAVGLASEALECFGGAGYIEDTGLPALLRDAQVLPIWEGTTNVLSLDTLKAMGATGGLGPVRQEVDRCLKTVKDAKLKTAVESAQNALNHAEHWMQASLLNRQTLEGGARRFALTVGRVLELALMCHHAQWCLDQGRGPRAAAVARRFARAGLDTIRDESAEDVALLVGAQQPS